MSDYIGVKVIINSKAYVTEQDQDSDCPGCFFYSSENKCKLSYSDNESIMDNYDFDCSYGIIYKEADTIKGKKKLLIL